MHRGGDSAGLPNQSAHHGDAWLTRTDDAGDYDGRDDLKAAEGACSAMTNMVLTTAAFDARLIGGCLQTQQIYRYRGTVELAMMLATARSTGIASGR